MRNPFAEDAATDVEDRELAEGAQSGNREALEIQIDMGDGVMKQPCGGSAFRLYVGSAFRRTSALVALVSVFCGACASEEPFQPETIIALERAALDRWGKGDPSGFFAIMADEQTYFDPMIEKRIDGHEALKKYIAPFTGKISIERVEMIDPKVQRVGDLAVLTFNLIDYGARMAGGPKTDARWNATEVFQRINGSWKIVHSHWSYTRPASSSS